MVSSRSVRVVLLTSAALAWGSSGAAQTASESSRLFDAVDTRDLERVQSLLASDADPDVRNANGETPLLRASALNAPDISEALLRAGADPNAVDRDLEGALGLHFPYGSESAHLLEVLLEFGADPSASNKAGVTPLMFAANARQPHLVATLLERGAYPLSADTGGMTALHYAALRGSSGSATLLLDAGVPIDEPDRLGRSPFLLAVGGGAPRTAGVLRGRGANTDHRDGAGNHALSYAAQIEEPGLLSLLLSWGIEPNLRGRGGSTALMVAATAGRREAVDLLLAAGADPDLANESGTTPLMAASRSGNLEVVQRLLAAGANPLATNRYGLSASEYARDRGHARVAQALGEADAGTDVADRPEPLAPTADLRTMLPDTSDLPGAVVLSQGPEKGFSGEAYGLVFAGRGELGTFTLDPGRVSSLELVASRYGSAPLARAALSKLDGLARELKLGLPAELGVPGGTRDMQAISLGAPGDSAVAYRYSVAGPNVDVEVWYSAFARGPILIFLFGLAPAGEADPAGFTELLRTIDDRVRRGAAAPE